MIIITDDKLYLETCYDETIFKLNYIYYNNSYNNLSLNAINIITRDYIIHDGIVYDSSYMSIKPNTDNFTKMKCTNQIHLRNTEVSIYSNTGRVCIDNFGINYIILNPIYSKDYVRSSSKRLMGKLIRDTYTISNCSYTHDSR